MRAARKYIGLLSVVLLALFATDPSALAWPGSGWFSGGAGSGGGGGSSATQYNFVFDTDGVAGGNVYTSWSTLYTAAHAIGNGVRVEVVGNDNHMTTGGPYNIDGWSFICGGATCTLAIDSGATGTFTNLWLRDLVVSYAGTSDFYDATGTTANLYLDGASLTTSTTGLFFGCGNTGFCGAFLYNASLLGDGTHTVLGNASGESGATFNLYDFNFSDVANSAISSATHFYHDDTAGSGGLPSSPAGTKISTADQVVYVAGVSGNWNPIPATPAAALDTLAAHHFVSSITTNQTSSTTVQANVTTIGAVTVANGDKWSIDWNLWVTVGTTTGGTAWAVNVPASSTMQFHAICLTNGSNPISESAEVTNTSGAVINCGNSQTGGTTMVVKLHAQVIAGGAGTVQLTFAEEAGGDTVTINAGSGVNAMAE